MPNNHETVVLKSENDKPVRQRHPGSSAAPSVISPTAWPRGCRETSPDAKGRWLAATTSTALARSQKCASSPGRKAKRWIATLATSHPPGRRTAPPPAIERRVRRLSPDQRRERLPARPHRRPLRRLPGRPDRHAGHGRAQARVGRTAARETGCQSVVERSEIAVRRPEGLQGAAGLLAGTSRPTASR